MAEEKIERLLSICLYLAPLSAYELHPYGLLSNGEEGDLEMRNFASDYHYVGGAFLLTHLQEGKLHE